MASSRSLATASSYSVVFDKSSKDEKVGISFKKDNDALFISGISEGSIISRTNLKEGDRVLSINGTVTDDLTSKESARLIRESMGSIEIIAEDPDAEALPTITVFGANGQCGREFVKIALENDYNVRAFVRDSSTYEEYADNPNVQVIQGDATDANDVEEAIEGVGFVTSFLGNPENNCIMFRSHLNIMTAAAKMTLPPRCIMISSVGFGGSSFLEGLLKMFGDKEKDEDHEMAEKCILNADEKKVPYIVVRPYALNDNEPSGYTVIEGETSAKAVSRKDLAYCFMFFVGDGGDPFVGKAVNIGG